MNRIEDEWLHIKRHELCSQLFEHEYDLAAVRHSTALAPDDPPQLPKQIQLVVIAVTQSSSGYWLPSSQRHRFL